MTSSALHAPEEDCAIPQDVGGGRRVNDGSCSSDSVSRSGSVTPSSDSPPFDPSIDWAHPPSEEKLAVMVESTAAAISDEDQVVTSRGRSPEGAEAPVSTILTVTPAAAPAPAVAAVAAPVDVLLDRSGAEPCESVLSRSRMEGDVSSSTARRSPVMSRRRPLPDDVARAWPCSNGCGRLPQQQPGSPQPPHGCGVGPSDDRYQDVPLLVCSRCLLMCCLRCMCVSMGWRAEVMPRMPPSASSTASSSSSSASSLAFGSEAQEALRWWRTMVAACGLDDLVGIARAIAKRTTAAGSGDFAPPLCWPLSRLPRPEQRPAMIHALSNGWRCPRCSPPPRLPSNGVPKAASSAPLQLVEVPLFPWSCEGVCAASCLVPVVRAMVLATSQRQEAALVAAGSHHDVFRQVLDLSSSSVPLPRTAGRIGYDLRSLQKHAMLQSSAGAANERNGGATMMKGGRKGGNADARAVFAHFVSAHVDADGGEAQEGRCVAPLAVHVSSRRARHHQRRRLDGCVPEGGTLVFSVRNEGADEIELGWYGVSEDVLSAPIGWVGDDAGTADAEGMAKRLIAYHRAANRTSIAAVCVAVFDCPSTPPGVAPRRWAFHLPRYRQWQRPPPRTGTAAEGSEEKEEDTAHGYHYYPFHRFALLPTDAEQRRIRPDPLMSVVVLFDLADGNETTLSPAAPSLRSCPLPCSRPFPLPTTAMAVALALQNLRAARRAVRLLVNGRNVLFHGAGSKHGLLSRVVNSLPLCGRELLVLDFTDSSHIYSTSHDPKKRSSRTASIVIGASPIDPGRPRRPRQSTVPSPGQRSFPAVPSSQSAPLSSPNGHPRGGHSTLPTRSSGGHPTRIAAMAKAVGSFLRRLPDAFGCCFHGSAAEAAGEHHPPPPPHSPAVWFTPWNAGAGLEVPLTWRHVHDTPQPPPRPGGRKRSRSSPIAAGASRAGEVLPSLKGGGGAGRELPYLAARGERAIGVIPTCSPAPSAFVRKRDASDRRSSAGPGSLTATPVRQRPPSRLSEGGDEGGGGSPCLMHPFRAGAEEGGLEATTAPGGGIHRDGGGEDAPVATDDDRFPSINVDCGGARDDVSPPLIMMEDDVEWLGGAADPLDASSREGQTGGGVTVVDGRPYVVLPPSVTQRSVDHHGHAGGAPPAATGGVSHASDPSPDRHRFAVAWEGTCGDAWRSFWNPSGGSCRSNDAPRGAASSSSFLSRLLLSSAARDVLDRVEAETAMSGDAAWSLRRGAYSPVIPATRILRDSSATAASRTNESVEPTGRLVVIHGLDLLAHEAPELCEILLTQVARATREARRASGLRAPVSVIASVDEPWTVLPCAQGGAWHPAGASASPTEMAVTDLRWVLVSHASGTDTWQPSAHPSPVDSGVQQTSDGAPLQPPQPQPAFWRHFLSFAAAYHRSLADQAAVDAEAAASSSHRNSKRRGATAAGGVGHKGGGRLSSLPDDQTVFRVLRSIPAHFVAVLGHLCHMQSDAAAHHHSAAASAGSGAKSLAHHNFISLSSALDFLESRGEFLTTNRLRAVVMELASNRLALYDRDSYALSVPQPQELLALIDRFARGDCDGTGDKDGGSSEEDGVLVDVAPAS